MHPVYRFVTDPWRGSGEVTGRTEHHPLPEVYADRIRTSGQPVPDEFVG
jgi:hypothetical protein